MNKAYDVIKIKGSKILSAEATKPYDATKSINVASKIKEVGENAFKGFINLENINLPNSVKSLENGAFENCASLKSIKVPKKIKEISSSMFAGCNMLEEVTLAGKIEKIENRAFDGCKSLKSISLPESLSIIEDHAFQSSGLEEFIFPKKVTEVSKYLFSNCASLKNVALNENIQTILASAFANCTSLKQVQMPSSVFEVEQFAFSGCESLETVKLSNRLSAISTGCFAGCQALKNIKIPHSVYKIQDNAFEGCSSLTELALPSNLTYVGNNVFKDCAFNYVSIDKETECAVYTTEPPKNVDEYKRIVDLKTFKSIEGFDIAKLFNEQSLDKYLKVADKLNKSKITLPYSFVKAMDKEGLIEEFENMDFRFFRSEIPQYGAILSSFNTEDEKAAFLRFANALGCFSTEKILDKNGMETQTVIAQKACSCLASILKVNHLTPEEIAKHCSGLSLKTKPSQDLIKFLSTKGEKGNFLNIDMLERLEFKYPGIFAKVVTSFEDVKNLRTGLDQTGKPHTIAWEEALVNYYGLKRYENISSDSIDIADLFIEKGIDQKTFDRASELRKEAVKDNVPSHILGTQIKEETILETIDRVKQETESILQDNKALIDELFNKKFTYEMLDKHDPKNAIIGVYCSCCATITSEFYGKKIAESTIIQKDVQNIVVRNSKGDIVAKGAMYVNSEKGYAVINAFELNQEYKTGEIAKGLYNSPQNSQEAKDRDLIFNAFMRGVNAFVKEYDKQNPEVPIQQVNVGLGYNRLQYKCLEFEKETNGLSVPAEYGFEDANQEQRILYKREDNLTKTSSGTATQIKDGGREE